MMILLIGLLIVSNAWAQTGNSEKEVRLEIDKVFHVFKTKVEPEFWRFAESSVAPDVKTTPIGKNLMKSKVLLLLTRADIIHATTIEHFEKRKHEDVASSALKREIYHRFESEFEYHFPGLPYEFFARVKAELGLL